MTRPATVNQQPPAHCPLDARYYSVMDGGSEPAATNALVEDEALQVILRMYQKHILPCPKFLVFSAFSLPQRFPS